VFSWFSWFGPNGSTAFVGQGGREACQAQQREQEEVKLEFGFHHGIQFGFVRLHRAVDRIHPFMRPNRVKRLTRSFLFACREPVSRFPAKQRMDGR
jgi:hypothetical protein